MGRRHIPGRTPIRLYEFPDANGIMLLVAATNPTAARKYAERFGAAEVRLLSHEKACAIIAECVAVPLMGIKARDGDNVSAADFNASTAFEIDYARNDGLPQIDPSLLDGES
jgi:hypothetical protein